MEFESSAHLNIDEMNSELGLWKKEENLYLLKLAEEYDFCYAVIEDRYNYFGKSRKLREIMENLFKMSKLTIPKTTVNINGERAQKLKKVLNRDKDYIDAEKEAIQNLRKIAKDLKGIQKKRKYLTKKYAKDLIVFIDGMAQVAEKRIIKTGIPKKQIIQTGNPSVSLRSGILISKYKLIKIKGLNNFLMSKKIKFPPRIPSERICNLYFKIFAYAQKLPNKIIS